MPGLRIDKHRACVSLGRQARLLLLRMRGVQEGLIKMTLRAGRVRLRIDVAMKYEGASEIMKALIDKASDNDVVIYTLMIGEVWKE